MPKVIGEARGEEEGGAHRAEQLISCGRAHLAAIMDGELVDIVLRFQRLQEGAMRLESRLGKLPVKRIKAELALLETELLEEIDRCTGVSPELTGCLGQ